MKVTNETRALAHEILAYWLRFNNHNQQSWVGDGYGDDFMISTVKLPGLREVNVCETTMCAAGTAYFLSNTPKDFIKASREFSYGDWMAVGGELLGLNEYERVLVFLSEEKSAKRYMRAIADGSKKKFDKATAKRISIEDVDED